MEIHTKFWDANTKRNPRRGRRWLLLLLVLAACAVLVWHFRLWLKLPWISAQAGPVVPLHARSNPVPVRAVTNRVAVVTNTPVSQSVSSTTTTNLTRTNAPVGPLPGFKQDVFDAQLALARLGFSSGSLDGLMGPQTGGAIRAFQRREGLPPTGELNESTRARLPATVPALVNYTVTTNDLARLQPLSKTWLGKSQQTALDYETVLEMLAEKSWSHPAYLRRINPEVAWTNVTAGTVVQLPNVAPPPRTKAAFVRIQLEARVLQVLDASTNVVAHFPCSIAQRVEKRPAGELHVAVAAANPNYTFDPEVFPESAEARQLRQKLIIPAGPNNPVGVAWIGLDLPGYGIHGTPRPEDVGRTESHGCFRLANWNAEHLLRLVSIGTPVVVEP